MPCRHFFIAMMPLSPLFDDADILRHDAIADDADAADAAIIIMPMTLLRDYYADDADAIIIIIFIMLSPLLL